MACVYIFPDGKKLSVADMDDYIKSLPHEELAKYSPVVAALLGEAGNGVRFSKSALLAPNGKPSNLNAMQHAQVRTPEFMAWFGDWINDPENASKVVDEVTGEPLVIYHGSKSKFNEFDTNTQLNGWAGKGFYFTPDKSKAKEFGRNIMPVFLKSNNPLISSSSDQSGLYSEVKKISNDTIKNDDITSTLKDSLYSGVFIEHWDFGKIITVFDPNQIKSATSNTGAFSQDNNDIRHSKSPQQTTSSTVAQVKSWLSPKVKAMVDSGKLRVVQSVNDLPAHLMVAGAAMLHTVWHGSPHDHNGFDMSKVGIGEGAQMFGYGLYFTDKKAIAEWYRDELSARKYNYKIKDVLYKQGSTGHLIGTLVGYYFSDIKLKPSWDTDWSEILSSITKDTERKSKGAINQDYWKNALNELNKLNADDLKNIKKVQVGSLYEVELQPNQDEYLDWDINLESQSDNIVSLLKKAKIRVNVRTGKDLYISLMKSKKNDKAASEYLHSLGIRGIRYKAEGGKSDANNYVIFSDDDITITNKYSKLSGIQGLYDSASDQVFLVADMLTRDNLNAVVTHELFHKSHATSPFVRKVMEKMTFSAREAFDQAARGKGSKNDLAAYQRVIQAKTPEKDQIEEMLAYKISSFLEDPKNTSPTFANLVKQWLAALRMIIKSNGLDLGFIQSLTPQDLVYLAGYGAKGDSVVNSRKQGALASFAGENAQTADKYQLATAKERLANGEDKEVVRRDTGWFMGVDGLPRFEIVDKKAKVKSFNESLSPDELLGVKKDKTPVTKFLGDLIDHDPLFSAYPQLKTMLVTMTPSLKPRRGASYNPKWNTINIETPYKTNGKLDLELSPLLHEVQHAIQTQEKFSEGGNLSVGGHEAYQRLAGEIEARNTQARLGLTAEQRRNTPLADTQDIPDSEAIVVWNNQVMNSSMPPANASSGVRFSVASSDSLKEKLLSNLSEQDKKVISALDRAMSIIKKNPSVIDNPEGRIRVLQYRMDKALKKASRGVNTAEVNDTTLLNELVKAELALEEGRNIITPLDVRSAVQKIQAQAESGIISTSEVARQINGLLTDLDTRKAQKVAKETLKPDLVRGTDWIKERLYRARRNGELNTGSIDLALWMLDKNPAIADDLAISIRDMKSDIAAGSYSVMNRVINLNNAFTGSGSNTVIAHEILHHTERLLPSELRNGILKEYSSRLSDLINNPDNYFDTSKYTTKELADIQKAVLNSSMGDKALLVKLIGTGKFPTESLYQLSNSSEFWAVNGERLINEKSKVNSLFSQIKQWYKELAEYVKSQLGYNSDHAVIKALDAIISGNNLSKFEGSLVDTYASRMLNYQHESDAIPDDFNFDNINLDSGVHYSLASSAATLSNALVEPTDNFKYNFYNKYIDLVNQVKKVGIKTANPIQAEENFHQRAAYRIDKFNENKVKPIIEAFDKAGFTHEQFNKAIHAINAKQVNADMADKTPTQAIIDANLISAKAKLRAATDKKTARKEVRKWENAQAFKGTETERLSLSGLTDKQANDILATLTPAQRTELTRLNVIIKALNDSTIDDSVSYGSITPAQGIELKKATPLTRKEAIDKYARMMERLQENYETAIRHGEHQIVLRSIADFISENPDDDFATLDDVPMITEERNGLIREVPDPRFKMRDNVVMYKVDGIDHAIVFNEDNPNNTRLALSIKKMDGVDLDKFESFIAQGTRWLASVNTQYNAVFGIVNLIRDTQGMALNLSSTELKGQQKSVIANIPKAYKAILMGLGRMKADPALLATVNEFNLEGGTTGFSQMFGDIKDRTKFIDDTIKEISPSKARKTWMIIKYGLSDFNTLMENVTRLAVYMTATNSKNNLDVAKAANIAKNITVNFNKKGAVTTKVGAHFAFFNAAIQGTARIHETMFNENGGLSDNGKRILVGGIGLGAAMTLVAMAAMGDDWDDIPEFIKERSLIIPAPWKQSGYISIPMPLGYHILPNIGRKAVEMAFGSKKVTNTRHLLDLAGSAVGAFNPLGGSDLLGAAMPTVLDPVMALARNKDWTGKSIYKEDFNSLNPTTGFSRTKDSATDASKWLAYWANWATGGTDAKRGLWSPTPDQIDYVAGQIFGGTGREILKGYQTATNFVNGEEVPKHKIPLLGRFYGDVSGGANESAAYHENLIKLHEHKAEMDDMRDKKKASEIPAYLRDYPEAKAVNSGIAIEKIIKHLVKQKKALIDRDAPKDQIQAKQDLITAKMKILNDKITSYR